MQTPMNEDFSLPIDPYFSKQWHLYNTGQTGGRKGVDLNVLPAWDFYRGDGIRVGVYDDGTYTKHPDLIGNWSVALQPLVDGQPEDPNPVTAPYRELVPSAHGTAVAGLIAAPINGIGVVGVAPEAQFGAAIVLVGEKGLKKNGAAEWEAAMMEAAYKQMLLYDVINHSYGYTLFEETWSDAIKERAFFKESINQGRGGLGVAQVIAGHNHRAVGDFTVAGTLSNMRQNIVVAAGSDLGDIIDYSTPGPSILVTAPVDVNRILGRQHRRWERNLVTPKRFLDKSTTTDIPGLENGFSGEYVDGLKASLPPDYSYTTMMNGTSAAAPMVSGVISLMLDANQNIGYRDIQEILAISARSPWQEGEYELYPWQTNGASYVNGGGFRYSHDYGFGFVDTAAAVRLSESWQSQRTSTNEDLLTAPAVAASIKADIPSDINRKLSYEFNVDSEMTVEWVELETTIDHTWWGDLEMSLISPFGTEHTLLNRIGVTPEFVIRLNPDTKSLYKPLGLKGTGILSQPFTSTVSRGESSVGQWKVEINGRSVEQGGAGGSGSLNGIELRLYGRATEEESDDDIFTYYYTDCYSKLVGLEPDRGLGVPECPSGSPVSLNFAAASQSVFVDLVERQASLADIEIPLAESVIVEGVFGGGDDDVIKASTRSTKIFGGWGDDKLFGRTGWDDIDGGQGNDFIDGGTGRDKITGGMGSDELHGGFGFNTFGWEQDGYQDLLAIKSDQWLINWAYDKAGNNSDGSKADIIEELDADDQIKIIGVFTPDISVVQGATAHGLTGIGIYAKGALEALYTGTGLSVAQIASMTTGDGSAAAMNNDISSYGGAGG
jgi:subtilisin family serine protease